MPAPLDGERVYFYLRASNAIWNGVTQLNLSPRDRVLFPSYHCGIELDAVLKAGVGVKFYPVGRDTVVTAAAIAERIDSTTKAVFVTHYFGFPQDMTPIVSLCRTFGLVLIEDCAHALYSRRGTRPVGLDGDMAAFSLWKSVPIPFGGALVVNRADLPNPEPCERPSLYETLRVMKKLAELRLGQSRNGDHWVKRSVLDPAAWAIRRMNRAWSNDVWRQQPIGVPRFPLERGRWGMPWLSLRMFLRAQEEEIVPRRRTHFAALLDACLASNGPEPLFATLPDGVCPLYFPVIAEDPQSLIAHFEALGILAYRFWDEWHPEFPAAEYDEAAYLKSHVVALPVHQALSSSDVDRICEGLRQRPRIMAVCLPGSRTS